jgi:peptidoglycan hydrolase CwlO-like protein
MTQATDTDIREIRDLLLGLDKKIDGVDKKLDSVDKKLDVYIAKTDEQLKNLETQISDIKVQMRSQDNRLWGFVAAVFLTVFGFVAKLTFLPGGT